MYEKGKKSENEKIAINELDTTKVCLRGVIFVSKKSKNETNTTEVCFRRVIKHKNSENEVNRKRLFPAVYKIVHKGKSL